MGNIRKAAGLYAKGGLFANAFECYERLEDWDGLIQCLNQYKDKFQANERGAYIERYFPIVLNSVYQLYANLDPEGAQQVMGGLTEENKGKIQQMKLKLKFQKSISIIREEVSEQSEEEESEEERKDDEEVEARNSGEEVKE